MYLFAENTQSYLQEIFQTVWCCEGGGGCHDDDNSFDDYDGGTQVKSINM